MTCHDFRLTCPVATHLSQGLECTRCARGATHWCALNNCRGNVAESIAYAVRGAIAHTFSLFRENVSVFITPSAMLRDHMVRLGGFDANQFVVVPNMVDTVEEPCDPGTGSYVAYAGRVAPEKGVDTLLEAAAICGLPLHVAGAHGPGGLNTHGANVIWRGVLGSASLAAFYRGARFVVTPSRWREAFGLVAAEAMMHGLPVVASRMGALPELVEDGQTGLLFETGDANALAESMASLWHDTERCRRMGRAARAKALKAYTSAKYYKNLLRVYEHAIALESGGGEASPITHIDRLEAH